MTPDIIVARNKRHRPGFAGLLPWTEDGKRYVYDVVGDPPRDGRWVVVRRAYAANLVREAHTAGLSTCYLNEIWR